MKGNWYAVKSKYGESYTVVNLPPGGERVLEEQGYDLQPVQVLTDKEFLEIVGNVQSTYYVFGRMDGLQ